MTSEQTSFDQDKARAFVRTMATIMNSGSLMIMTSIGHQTGLFDAMAGLPASTSVDIAAAAGLNERYVREWLAAMVTGRIVEYNPQEKTYYLPPEHAASLTRSAGPANLAGPMVLMTEVSRVEQQIVRCFREGGGVPYSEFERFDAIMAESSGRRFDALLLREILPLVPGLAQRLEAGIDVADMGCGSGRAINLMAKAFPNSRFTGYDFGVEAIATAKAEASDLGVANATFVVRDVAELDELNQFDLITAFDAIHDQARPDLVLKGIYEALRPGGVFLCADFYASSNLEENLDHPSGPMMYTISTMHCMTVSLALGGMGLGTAWGRQVAVEMMKAAGFPDVSVHRIREDRVNSYYIATK